MTMNLVPGASWLGACLSVYDMRDPGRLARRLFDLGIPSTQKVGTQTYDLPASVMFQSGDGKSSYRAKTYRNEVEFAADYRANAKFSGQAGVSSGSLQAKWQQLTSNRSDRVVVDVATMRSSYQLELTHRSPESLSSDVREDQLYKDLPDSFTPASRHAFFSFFRRYGTHYVSRVELGGELHYFCILESAKASDEIKIEAEAKFEYGKAFGVDAGASGVTLDKDWATSREVQIESRPASDISTVENTDGTLSDSSGYKQWILASTEDPAIIDFTVSPICELFSGAMHDALESAAREYSQSLIYAATAVTRNSALPGSISLSGRQLEPSNLQQATACGQLRAWQVIIDKRNLAVTLSKVYAAKYTPKIISGDMLDDLTPFLDDSNYIVILTTFVSRTKNYTAPYDAQDFIVTSDMYDTRLGWGQLTPRQKKYIDALRNMGAGSELVKATTRIPPPPFGKPGESWGYAFIGVSGSGPVSRDCVEVCSHQPVGVAPTTDALLVLLEPELQNQSDEVTYTPVFGG